MVEHHDVTCRVVWQMDIMKGEMLSDIPINVAQRLLKKQLPNLRGLQPTVYQQKNQTARGVMVENKLQIMDLSQ